MNKREFYYPSQDGKTQIHAIAWEPTGEVCAVLQICHGMIEFVDRYDDFARFLAQRGYYVTGNDHLGHGESVTDASEYGYFAREQGNECVVGDIHTLREMTHHALPHVPYFMLGHSMGSFLLRQYLTLHGQGLAGAIVMGTGDQPPLLLGFGRALCRLLAAVHGWHYRSKLIQNMAFGAYNKRISPAPTGAEWLTKDTDIVNAYVSNPWCTFSFTLNGYDQMFAGIQKLQDPGNMEHIPKSLPMLLVSGEEDPVGNYGKAVKKVYRDYLTEGLNDVKCKLYPNDRHEILNETDRHTVYADLLRWLEHRRLDVIQKETTHAGKKESSHGTVI